MVFCKENRVSYIKKGINSVGLVNKHKMYDWEIVVRFPAGVRNSLLS